MTETQRYTLTYYQSYAQHGKAFENLEQLSEFAISLHKQELGYCTTYIDNKTKKRLSGNAFRNWLNKIEYEQDSKLW